MWGKTSLRRTACTRFAQESSLPLFLALLLLYKQKIDLILSISIYRKASVFSDASVGRIHSSAMSDSTHRPHLHNYVTQCLHKHAYRHMLLTCTHTHTHVYKHLYDWQTHKNTLTDWDINLFNTDSDWRDQFYISSNIFKGLWCTMRNYHNPIKTQYVSTFPKRNTHRDIMTNA